MNLVSEIMKTELIVVSPDTNLDDAVSLILKHNIHHLPVVDKEKKPVGMVSDRDLRMVTDSPFLKLTGMETIAHLAEHSADEIMHRSLYTIEKDKDITEAAKLIRVSKLGSLMVVDEQECLIGLVTSSDLIDHLIRVLEPIDS